MRTLLLLYIALLSFSCKQDREHEKAGQHQPNSISFEFYSPSVRDSFTINGYVPDSSLVKNPGQLPVIYVLDTVIKTMKKHLFSFQEHIAAK